MTQIMQICADQKMFLFSLRLGVSAVKKSFE